MPASLNDALLQILACPHDRTRLHVENNAVVCERAHQFPFEDGIPIFAENPRREPIPLNMGPCPHPSDGPHAAAQSEQIDPFVDDWIVNTNGNLYWRARGRLPRYPIPDWPFGDGKGGVMVEIGCSWGRWSIAAARGGFVPVGTDVHVDALAAAARVSRQLGAHADFICCDAEHLPFQSGSVDFVFSYSVLQHLDKSKVRRIFQRFRASCSRAEFVSSSFPTLSACSASRNNSGAAFVKQNQALLKCATGRMQAFALHWNKLGFRGSKFMPTVSSLKIHNSRISIFFRLRGGCSFAHLRPAAEQRMPFRFLRASRTASGLKRGLLRPTANTAARIFNKMNWKFTSTELTGFKAFSDTNRAGAHRCPCLPNPS